MVFEVTKLPMLHKLMDYIRKSLDISNKCLVIFLDLAKPFDTVSLPLLLKKLSDVDARGLYWLDDCLTERLQCIHVAMHHPVSYGVPPGSILGPTLFLVYIKDISHYLLLNSEKLKESTFRPSVTQLPVLLFLLKQHK